MRALVTRVKEAEVIVGKAPAAAIKEGLVVFLGVKEGDSDSSAAVLAKKIANLRVFENRDGKLDYSVKDKKLPVLCISNFTLYANTDKGRRPSFDEAMAKEDADKLFSNFVLLLEGEGIAVKTGVFGQHMDIRLNMEGPVNIVLSG